MKEQEVLCFTLDVEKESQGKPNFDADGYITNAINDRVKALNANGCRVVNISFPKAYYGNTVTVCLFWEDE